MNQPIAAPLTDTDLTNITHALRAHERHITAAIEADAHAADTLLAEMLGNVPDGKTAAQVGALLGGFEPRRIVYVLVAPGVEVDYARLYARVRASKLGELADEVELVRSPFVPRDAAYVFDKAMVTADPRLGRFLAGHAPR